MTPEEERAAAYQAQGLRRVGVMRQRAQALSGSPTALAALKRRWAPMTDHVRERRGGPGGTAAE